MKVLARAYEVSQPDVRIVRKLSGFGKKK